jgi:5-methyltetrahydropteroyltriglutamate--homocysteine methyltransferase
MIGCYLTGILPRPKELIKVTRAYDRGKTDEDELEKAFEHATLKVMDTQISDEFSYVTDGMLKWQDLFRPLTENLSGVKMGSLARWFNNNTFYRKPIVVGDMWRKKSIVEDVSYTKYQPKNLPWKAILPAPYTFVQLSENKFYTDETELMFKYAEVLRDEIRGLARQGFKYVQLSDPALVYKSTVTSMASDNLNFIGEALKIAVKGIPVKTCLQTFFGDFSQILPGALNFPVDHLGIDLYETDFEELKKHSFDKGVALGLVDSRSSLVEKEDELITVAKEIVRSIYRSRKCEVFVCANCDLEFLPWEKAEEKMRVISGVTESLKEEFS